MCLRNPSLMTLREDDSKTWLFSPRGQVLGLASLLPHFSGFSLSQQCPSSFLGWVVFSYWRVGTSEAQLPPPLWDCCTDSKPRPTDPSLLRCLQRGAGGPGVWEPCLCKEHSTLAQVYSLWGSDTVYIQVKHQDLYSAWLCIQALHRQAVWSQTSLVPFLNLNFLIWKVDTNATCCSVAQSCPTLCDLMDCSTPGFPVLHCLLDFVQTHVYWVNYVNQPSHPLCPLLLLPSIFPSIRVFSTESALCIKWPKYWSFSFSISPSNEYSGLISFRIDWFDLAAQGILKSLLQHHSLKESILWHSALVYGSVFTPVDEKPYL